MDKPTKVKVNISFTYVLEPMEFPTRWTLTECLDAAGQDLATNLVVYNPEDNDGLNDYKDFQVKVEEK